MRLKFPLLLLFIYPLCFIANAQQVPSRIAFANMDLRLTSDAIRDIQADVDALTRSEKYFQKKLERVDMYMPIIERIFQEEGLPEDFKYLVIQESALVSDAVSSSNAVGFWQFKEISGLENNLRIDRYVDERMNIVSSSRAAANYLKSHNEYFDNWAYALIAYQRGRGGAMDVVDESNFGKDKLKITSDTYWYLKKYLAHKVAFENVLGTSKTPYYLKEVSSKKSDNLKTIAKQEEVPYELLVEYNKWLKRSKIPEDKEYTIVVPLSNLEKITKLQNQKEAELDHLPGDINDKEQQKFPLVDHYPSKSDRSIPHKVEINGLDGIYAPAGYTVQKLAEVAGIEQYKFRKFNDLKIREELTTGRIYYLRRKRNRAKFYYHTVTESETMWDISQKYGVKLKKLYRKNRMEPPAQPRVGRVLWLRQNRPANVEIEYRTAPKVEKDEPKQQEVIETVINEQQPDTIHNNHDSSKNAINPIHEKLKDSIVISSSDSLISETLSDSNSTEVDTVLIEEKTEEIDSTEVEVGKNIIEESSKEEDIKFENENESVQADLMEYTIRKGDTFFSIANRFNMKISNLLSVNELNIRDTLSIGQIIKVNKVEYFENPSKEGSQTDDEAMKNSASEAADQSNDSKTIEHKVESGDTMYALARKYNVSLKDIMEWNNKNDYTLKEGELILIKQK
ncbi:LysM peptidoglycan-binding domain-containing protein [Marivirga arenosa]|uniref:LysM peptidoglycan-binding domain-containing protein n=1 Tax=Marivirga arenosa TaxID=3059076 RepID=A0AA51R9Z5_9BACT|nr:LysM peptidoglycan-binding domain-containing protein [Marivirga sp. ABR2-2]WMN06308.1 LysM peptidoglycan-binding domain-containing protein [Marivirga sp. ABR2-2]